VTHSVRSQEVPVSLTEYVFQRKLINSFRLYIYLKFKTSGIVSSKSSVFKDLLEIRGLTSSKTIKKHLSKLIEMNWVGYNSHSTNYFLRNIQYICNNLNLDTKKVVKITISDLGNLTVFLAAVTMNGLVRNQFLYFEKVYPRNHFAAVKKSGTALQAKYSSHSLDMEVSDNTKPEYYGFSNAKLGSVLGVSISYASKLQSKASAKKYIGRKQRTSVFLYLTCRNYTIRNELYKSFPELKGKLFFRESTDGELHDFLLPNGKFARLRLLRHIELVRQLHNEVEPCIDLKSSRKGPKHTKF